MSKIKAVSKTSINKLFWAINHYVSTGDHISEGVSEDLGDSILVLLPVNPDLPVDMQDFERFRARLDELGEKIDGPFESVGFLLYTWQVAKSDTNKFARLLTEKPGPLGWGSMKETIDAHTWDFGEN